MGAETPGLALRIEEGCFLQSDFQAFRESAARSGSSDLAPGNFFLWNTPDTEATVRLNDIFGRGFDEMGRDAFRFFDDSLRSDGQRPAADHRAAAAEGASALLTDVRITVQDSDVVHRSLGQLRGDLRPRGLMSLAVGARSSEHGNLAGALDAHGAAFEAGAAAGFDKRRKADADEFAPFASLVALAQQVVIA